MQTLTVRLPRPHKAQREILKTRKRFNVADCGRRFGKSTLTHQLVSEVALKGQPVGLFCPTYKDADQLWEEVKNTFHAVTISKDETYRTLNFITGGRLEVWSLSDPDSGRGRKYARAIIDEAAKIGKLEYSWQNVVRPTLADMRGDAYFFSTPKGLNYFYNLYRREDNEPGEWKSWKYSTYDNPHIAKSEVDAMKGELPERVFSQEILAAFVTDGSYFQRIDERATVEACDEPQAHAGHAIYGGLDFAMTNDYTVLTLGCRQCNRVVWWDRFNQIDYTYQRGRIIEACNRWNLAGLLPERNSIGQPNIELLEAAGLPILWGHDLKPGFSTTATTKPELIQSLAGALEHDGFTVPQDYADELRSYEVMTSANGRNQFSAPEGQHDDRVMSLALCWWAMTKTGRAGL
jgi:hypothetical protein